jgi:hypothetical protein
MKIEVNPDGEFVNIEFLIDYSFIKVSFEPLRKILNESFGT